MADFSDSCSDQEILLHDPQDDFSLTGEHYDFLTFSNMCSVRKLSFNVRALSVFIIVQSARVSFFGQGHNARLEFKVFSVLHVK